MSMTQESVEAILGSRVMITEPGKYKVKVTSTNVHNERTLCNFNAMTPYNVEQTKADIADGNLDDCLNHNLVSGQRLGKDFTPAKGDFVNIHVDYVDRKDGEGQALLVVAVEEIKAAASKKVSVSSFFGVTEEDEEAPAKKAKASAIGME